MFLSDDNVERSFSQLRAEKAEGKVALERTSALLYFLAYDMLTREPDLERVPIIDLNPATPKGSYNRNRFSALYINIATISQAPLVHVSRMGYVENKEPRPEKRISANLFTTSLKQASQSLEEKPYPSRPAPLLLLGRNVNGSKWGSSRHPKWRENIRHFLETRSSTPYTDFAIFLLRGHSFSPGKQIGRPELSAALRQTVSQGLSDHWEQYLILESAKRSFPVITLQQHASTVLQLTEAYPAVKAAKKQVSASQSKYVFYLESLLEQHGIEFKKED